MQEKHRATPLLDGHGDEIHPGHLYRLKTGGSAILVDVSDDGQYIVPAPSFVATFFKLDKTPVRIDALPKFCSLYPFEL